MAMNNNSQFPTLNFVQRMRSLGNNKTSNRRERDSTSINGS